MQLRSIAFGDGEEVPLRFTCDGDNVSPPLEWRGAPQRTQSFVLLCTDPDAPSGVWRHWAVYDIPADKTGLADGVAANAPGIKQAVNDFGHVGYGGPCPPPGHGAHHYHFMLMALDTPSLRLGARASCADVERAARPHLLAEADLTGLYER
ncbi:MAG TPA: YbhB/YbcL family Raf kinase inhibitor-like protein [Caulobacterales bacterium]|nr:YbhB/YbcL family Raf kinase inhibitor-like protein [Caulobacterales bacterium]